MKNRKNWIKGVFTIAIIILLLYFLYKNRDDVSVLLDISWYYIVLIAIGIIFVQITNSLFLKTIVKVFNKDMPVSEATEVTFLSALTNTLTPFRGGAGVRAVYLKENFNLEYKKFVTVLFGNYVIIFLVATVLGFLATLTFLGDDEIRMGQLYITMGVFLAIAVMMIFLILFDLEKILKFIPERWKLFRSLKKVLIKIYSGWQQIVGRKDILLSLLVLTIVNYLLVMFVFYLELRAINIHVQVQNLMVYSSLSIISLLVSLTPGALGVKEAILLFGQDLIGLNSTQIITISVFDRTLALVTVIMGFLSIYTHRKLRGKSDPVNKELIDEATSS